MNTQETGNEVKYCTATHPQQPNRSGHARGRKMHIAKNDKFTICNMLVDQIITKNTEVFKHFDNNGRCKSCFSSLPKTPQS